MIREIVCCIIENDKGELLLQKKTLGYKFDPGVWCLFGGHAESKNLSQEIERELKEEIGIKLKTKFIFMKKIKHKEKMEIMNVFLSRLNDPSKICLKEGAGFAYFGMKELKKLNIAYDIKLILNEYFKIKKVKK